MPIIELWGSPAPSARGAPRVVDPEPSPNPFACKTPDLLQPRSQHEADQGERARGGGEVFKGNMSRVRRKSKVFNGTRDKWIMIESIL